MSSSSVRALAQLYAYDRADATRLEFHYEDAIRKLAHTGWFADVTLVSVDATTGTFTIPSGGVAILGVFHDDSILDALTLTQVEQLNAEWRSEVGTPKAYITEDESRNNFTIYPRPANKSKDFSFVTGTPLGEDFPEYAVAVIHTKIETNEPEFLELALAFRILADEFSLESQIRDEPFAKLCNQMADVFLGVLQ